MSDKAANLVEFDIAKSSRGEPAAALGLAASPQIAAPPADLQAEADTWLDTQVAPLHNPTDPRWTLKREKYEHRLIIYLKCNGFTNREIANKTGFHIATINNVCKQPWARSIILTEITKAGRDQVETVLQGEALESVLKLIDIRDDEKTPVETKRKAANDLLDRYMGKPNTPITHSHVDPRQLSAAQLLAIARQGLQHGGPSN